MSKLSPKHYAQAFLDVLESGSTQADAIKGLLRSMSTHGDMAKRGEVLAAVEKELVARSGGRLVKLELAHALGVAERKALLSEWKESDRVSTSVNPDLVAGLRILVNGESELDMSLTAKLDKVLSL